MDPFVGQLLLVPLNFAPTGWAFCQGQLMPISQNTALFSLLGTQYGGDGRSTFALPNLQGMMPIGYGNGSGGYSIGQTGGEQSVTLLTSQLPSHNHTQEGTTVIPSSGTPSGLAFGQDAGRGQSIPYYVAAPTAQQTTTMAAQAIALSGGGQPHPNMMPTLVLSYIIALQGVYPPRS